MGQALFLRRHCSPMRIGTTSEATVIPPSGTVADDDREGQPRTSTEASS